MDMQTWRDSHSRATDAREAFVAALEALGVPESAWNAVRPVVTYTGTPYVHLGMIRADVVEQVAEALRLPSSH
ncbi:MULTISPECIES: hypothetical protein [unclassified Streptomyces]|uniref:hypothetical protein n=1 Tax=unclassified Streptomyces TaxID=2593676 RepID=UPI001BEAA4AA|nr:MULTISPECIES: hypothetical protein [unclassified Streptomyces]MBT2403549.1 hypothetical protein [Streptomyces sp. ISL-21]MBT2458764.1 hypothetical protein [Streptomyces sp. ISL-86]MBT2609974.1 hypothetical protein [Streptomyces sp. ISL-87]